MFVVICVYRPWTVSWWWWHKTASSSTYPTTLLNTSDIQWQVLFSSSYFYLFIYFRKKKKNDYYYLHFVFYFDGVVIPLSISSMSLVSQVLKCVFGGGVGSLWKTVFDRNEVNNRQKWLERPVIGRHGGIKGAKRVPISVLSVCIYYTTSLKEKKRKTWDFIFSIFLWFF